MTERPLLFLDVDGVLNCLGRYQAHYEHHKLDGIPVWVPPGTAGRLRRLLDVFEPVWATAWLGSAHTSWRHVLGLSEASWPYVDYRALKLPSILRFAGERRWAWVDDDAPWELRELGWTDRHIAGLILSPDPERGLTDDHVDQLVEFASPVSGLGHCPATQPLEDR